MEDLTILKSKLKGNGHYVRSRRLNNFLKRKKFKSKIYCNKTNNQINKIFENNKLLTICASDNIVRLAPPLIIKIKHVDEAVRKIRRSLINYNN